MKNYLLYLMFTLFIYSSSNSLQNLESHYTPAEQTQINEAVIEMQTNFSLINSIQILSQTHKIEYKDLKPVSDYVINKLYAEKSLCLLSYFYCAIDNEQIRNDIDDKIHLLELEIEKTLNENHNTVIAWR